MFEESLFHIVRIIDSLLDTWNLISACVYAHTSSLSK